MTLFLASLVAIVAAPFLIGAFRRIWGVIGFFDAFVLVSVGGLVLLHILPHAVAEGGVLALCGAAIGIISPVLTHALFHRGTDRVRDLTLVIGLLGLAVHALLDGVALTAQHHDHEHGRLLAMAVALHRLPVGIAIWWIVTPRFGRRIAVVALGLILGATTAGFFGGEMVHQSLEGQGWSAFQAFVAGMLLHVAAGHGGAESGPYAKTFSPVASVIGALVAVAGLWAISSGHSIFTVSGAMDPGSTLIALALRSAPPLLLACLVASALRGFVPSSLPHLVTAPAIGVVSALLSLQLLGWGLGLIHVGAAALVIIALRLWQGEESGASADASGIKGGLRFGFVTLADRTIPWLLAGIGAASLMEALVDPGHLARVPGVFQPAMAVLIAFPLRLSAVGLTPLAAILVHKGMTPGASIALLLTGPVTDVVRLGALAAERGRLVATVFALILNIAAVASGWLINWLCPPAWSQVPLHELTAGNPEWLSWASLVFCAALTLLSLLRQGVPNFVGQVLSWEENDR